MVLVVVAVAGTLVYVLRRLRSRSIKEVHKNGKVWVVTRQGLGVIVVVVVVGLGLKGLAEVRIRVGRGGHIGARRCS